MFQRIATRFVHDLGVGPAVLAPVLADKSPEDQADLLMRLTVLYDIICPAPTKDRDHGA